MAETPVQGFSTLPIVQTGYGRVPLPSGPAQLLVVIPAPLQDIARVDRHRVLPR